MTNEENSRFDEPVRIENIYVVLISIASAAAGLTILYGWLTKNPDAANYFSASLDPLFAVLAVLILATISFTIWNHTAVAWSLSVFYLITEISYRFAIYYYNRPSSGISKLLPPMLASHKNLNPLGFHMFFLTLFIYKSRAPRFFGRKDETEYPFLALFISAGAGICVGYFRIHHF